MAAPLAGAPAGESGGPRELSVADILIVDDMAPIRALLRAFLERDVMQQYRFLEAASVAEASAQCRIHAPDVVLLDIGLPDGTGFDFLQMHRDDMGLFPFAVVILTGESSEESAIQALRAGVQDYLKKGRINQETLRRSVRMSLERHSLLRHVREQRTDLARQIDRMILLNRPLPGQDAPPASPAPATPDPAPASTTPAASPSSGPDAAMENYYLHSLLLSMPDRIYFKDRESRFLRVNAAMARLAQVSAAEELLGKTDADLFTQEHAATALEDEKRIVETGEPLVGVVEKETTHGGRVMWVSTTKMPLRDRTGAIVGTFGISRDITHIKNVEADLRRANEELARHERELESALARLEETHSQLLAAQQHLGEAEKMQTVGRLAAGVAHEVKNPLGVLSMGLGYLRSASASISAAGQGQAGIGRAPGAAGGGGGIQPAGPARHHSSVGWSPGSGRPCPPATIVAVIDQMQKAVDRAQQVVHELLDFSRPGTGGHPMDRVEMDGVVRDALRLMRHTFATRQIRVQENIGLALPPVLGDAQKLSQLLLNLLMNAADAMDPVGSPAAIPPAATPSAPVTSASPAPQPRRASFAPPPPGRSTLTDADRMRAATAAGAMPVARTPGLPEADPAASRQGESAGLVPLDPAPSSALGQASPAVPLPSPGAKIPGKHLLTVTVRETVLNSLGDNVGAAETGCFRVGDHLIVVEIDDSGPGIAPEVLGRIFDPFYTTKPTSHGTGLGLSVARTIADLHGAVLRIRNLPGKGARACLTLRALPPGTPAAL